MVGKIEWPMIKGKLSILYLYIIVLFFTCFILARRFDLNMLVFVGKISTTQNTKEITPKLTNNNNYTSINDLPKKRYKPLICHPTNITQTCPIQNYSSQTKFTKPYVISSNQTCPDYFRWIHQDLNPWKEKGITREMVEAGKSQAFFRLVILDGKVYVETYKKSFQTRDVFTIWGILQLLRLYPGKLPDLDMMFECDDKPVIKKKDYAVVGDAPPMFHYCGDDHTLDIAFPDWSFWGWHEINIKPWELILKDFKEGNQRVKWLDRVPYAYWKGNLHMGRRQSLLICNSTQQWNAQIYAQKWAIESRHGFRESNVANQCTHRYKIYMEGKGWSVSEKYIQACDSMLLLVMPRYYEFFTRSLVPLKHYWPINPWKKLCNSIKFAVDWGNKHPQKVEEIGKAGHKFVAEDLKMRNIYDYMFHLLNEYSKLLKYKPIVPQGAVEICSEKMVCDAFGKEKQSKIDTIVNEASQTSPCTMPPAYDPQHLQEFLRMKEKIYRKVDKWVDDKNLEVYFGT